MRFITLCAALWLPMLGWAQSESTAAAKGAVERPTPEAASEPVDVAAFVAPEAKMLRELDVETSRLTRELKNAELKAAIAGVGKEKEEGPGSQASRSGPELLGVSSARGKAYAEFLVGDGVIEFGVGDWVTPEYKIVRIGSTSVELRDRKGRSSQMAVGVSRPTQGAMPAPSAAPVPMSLSMPQYPAGAVVVPRQPVSVPPGG